MKKLITLTLLTLALVGCGAYYSYEKTSATECSLSAASNRSVSKAAIVVDENCSLEAVAEGLVTPESVLKDVIKSSIP